MKKRAVVGGSVVSKTVNGLQKEIFMSLTSDSELSALIGANKIFDHPIKKTNAPYIIMANWQVNDWSTDIDYAEEHLFILEVWDKLPSRKRLQEITQQVIENLHDKDLELDFGTLVNLRFENTFLTSQGSTKLQLARLNFRAVVEF